MSLTTPPSNQVWSAVEAVHGTRKGWNYEMHLDMYFWVAGLVMFWGTRNIVVHRDFKELKHDPIQYYKSLHDGQASITDGTFGFETNNMRDSVLRLLQSEEEKKFENVDADTGERKINIQNLFKGYHGNEIATTGFEGHYKIALLVLYSTELAGLLFAMVIA
jgi:hypothetical protein